MAVLQAKKTPLVAVEKVQGAGTGNVGGGTSAKMQCWHEMLTAEAV